MNVHVTHTALLQVQYYNQRIVYFSHLVGHQTTREQTAQYKATNRSSVVYPYAINMTTGVLSKITVSISQLIRSVVSLTQLNRRCYYNGLKHSDQTEERATNSLSTE